MKSRLLVVHTGGVGDFVCLMPALAALADLHRIEIAGIRERATLALRAGLVEAVHDLNSTGFHSLFTTPDARLQAFVARFDRALVFMADDDGQIKKNLHRAGLASVRCVPGVPPASWTESAALWYAQGLETTITLPYRTPFPAAPKAPRVILHPGSGGRAKNWPLAHFYALADVLEDRGLPVTWCAGPAEEFVLPAGRHLPAMALAELAGVLAGARLYVGNDSGISHLAAATGCPSVVIFGPTNPSVWAPVGPRLTVLRDQPWPTVEAVATAALRMLETNDAGVRIDH